MIQRIIVPDQNPNNLFKLTAGDGFPCCGETVSDCQYTASYTQANSVSALTILENGANRVLPLTIGGGSSATVVRDAILDALYAAGYEDDDNTTWFGVVVNDLGTTLEVIITGAVVAVSLTASGGTATFDADCNIVGLCTFAITGYAGGTTGTAATTLRINGGAQDIGTVTPGTTTAGTVATAVQGALTAAGVAGTASVTTTGSGGSQTYNITITGSESDNTFALNGVLLSRSACASTYA